ncbi:MAG TPA: cytochrome c oxidase subunit II [Micropepsaceae bacterium]|nr:cytochrome c oxidase subunit II [Micropepsaceae bacterium]
MNQSGRILGRLARAVSTPFRVAAAALGLLALHASAAWASQPMPWQLNLQDPATAKMEKVHEFHDLLLVIITAIVIFVLALLLWVMIRYNSRANPTPSKTSHNTLIEVIWTVVPVAILVVIAIPSFKLLYYSDTIPQADLTVKVIGKQWYWTYEYPDNGNFTFDSLMLTDEEAAAKGEPRLLGVDNRIVVPVGKNVVLDVTAADVIHAFAMPAFGIKIDAIPGRLNQTWFKAEREGVYYGQCSELCGSRHAFMPIVIEVVSEAEFNAWVASAQQQFGAADGETITASAGN